MSDVSIGRSGLSQIGFARVITDQVTFAYLTDVYILPAYQGDGLGSWLTECVGEELESWPDLRRAMCVTSLEKGKEFYEKTMGLKPFEAGPKGMAVLTKSGKGSAF
jgi:GNAT superfamily N-acetyltransferase